MFKNPMGEIGIFFHAGDVPFRFDLSDGVNKRCHVCVTFRIEQAVVEIKIPYRQHVQFKTQFPGKCAVK